MVVEYVAIALHEVNHVSGCKRGLTSQSTAFMIKKNILAGELNAQTCSIRRYSKKPVRLLLFRELSVPVAIAYPKAFAAVLDQ
jgi:hypothetical protein